MNFLFLIILQHEMKLVAGSLLPPNPRKTDVILNILFSKELRLHLF